MAQFRRIRPGSLPKAAKLGDRVSSERAVAVKGTKLIFQNGISAVDVVGGGRCRARHASNRTSAPV